MNIENEEKQSIIEVIFESKRDEYELEVEKKNKQNPKRRSVDQILEDMENCYHQNIPDKSKQIVKECHRKLDYAWSENLDFWKQEFYKLGFRDGIRMAEEIKEKNQEEL